MGSEQTEICANCGRQIGKLEAPMVWEDRVVCGECYGRLSGSATPARAPIRGSAGVSGRAKLAIGTLAVVFVVAASTVIYRYHQQELAAKRQARREVIAFRRLRKIRGLERFTAQREASISVDASGNLVPKYRSIGLVAIKNAVATARRLGYDAGPTAARCQSLTDGYRLLRDYDNKLCDQLIYLNEAESAWCEKVTAEDDLITITPPSPKEAAAAHAKIVAARARRTAAFVHYAAAQTTAEQLLAKVKALE